MNDFNNNQTKNDEFENPVNEEMGTDSENIALDAKSEENIVLESAEEKSFEEDIKQQNGFEHNQYNQNPYMQNPYSQNPYMNNQYVQNPYNQNNYNQNNYNQNPYNQNPYNQNPYQNMPGQNPYNPNPYEFYENANKSVNNEFNGIEDIDDKKGKKGKKTKKRSKFQRFMRGFVCAVAILVAAGVGAGAISYVVFNAFPTFSFSANVQTTPQLSDGNSGSSSEQTTTTPNEVPDITIVDNGSSSITYVEGSGEKLTTPQIYAKVTPSVVGIQAQAINSTSSVGTGIVLSEDGYIITNNHVIDGAQFYTIVMYDETQYKAELVGSDETTDLAVLKVTLEEGETLVPAEFGNSEALVVGDLAIAIGNPGGLELQSTLTGGYISAINRNIVIDDREMTLIQTDAAINPGNSGGPLINEYGQVIGINTIKISSTEYEGLGFAIPIAEAMPIVEEIIAYGYVLGRPAIGITGMNITEAEAYYNNIPQGLYVASVDVRSDAYAKGLQSGDIIVGVNGVETKTVTEINEIRDQFKAGDTITLQVYRSGRTFDLAVVLMDEYDLQEEVVTQTTPSTQDNTTNNYGSYFPFGSYGN